MPKVSIVVPVYNVEKYLSRCIDSLIHQTLNEIEIILVDDGSTDQSSVIIEEYLKADSRICAIHKENGGLSSARNVGLEVATGQYVGFVDSDDDVALDMFQKMFEAAISNNVDVVMCDYMRIASDLTSRLISAKIPEGRYDQERIRELLFPELIMGRNLDYGPLLSVWHCLYRREFLSQYKLRFDEQVRWSEDNIFSAEMGYFCKSFFYMKAQGLYHYYQNPGTITTSYRKGAWEVYCTMNEHLHQFFDGVDDYDFSQQLYLHLVYYACNCIGQTSKLPEKEAKEKIREILSYPELKKALKSIKTTMMPFRLRIQLAIMRRKQTFLLYWLKTRKR